jgi:hypothetical protein
MGIIEVTAKHVTGQNIGSVPTTSHSHNPFILRFTYTRNILILLNKLKTKLNSVVLVRKRTIPTERPQPVGEVSVNFS